jgi:hypothetical protein
VAQLEDLSDVEVEEEGADSLVEDEFPESDLVAAGVSDFVSEPLLGADVPLLA